MKTRTTHILVECPELIASVQVGVLNVLRPLEDSVCSVRFRETRRIEKEDIQWCDIFICVRGSEPLTEAITAEVKRLGRLVFYFLDDDLLHLPEETLSKEYFQYEENRKALCSILSRSDGLWGVNEKIREIYLPLCGTRRWIWSRVPAIINPSPKEGSAGDVTKVLYAGSVDHKKVVRDILAPAAELVIQHCGRKVEFTFVGPDPGLKGRAQVHHQPFFNDYEAYRTFVESQGFQIGLAPTRQGEFFQCKYYNKFVEYTSVGAVAVYTDCPLYRQVVEHEENGLLCENTPEDWAGAIIRLIEQPQLRQQCLRNAAALIQDEFNPDTVAQGLLEQIPELREFRAPQVSISQIKLAGAWITNTWLLFYIGRARYLLHRYHLLGIPIIAYKTIKILMLLLIRKVFNHG